MIENDVVGTIYKDWMHGKLRCLVLRGPMSLCAYLGTRNFLLANRNYDDIPLNVHGGLTFGRIGDGLTHPKEYYWYGWDYLHFEDYMYLPPDVSKLMGELHSNRIARKHTVEEVVAETDRAASGLRKILRGITLNYWLMSLFLMLAALLGILGLLLPLWRFL